MYYPKSKIIFPHIPKTGGSSLEYFMGQIEHPVLFNSKYKNVDQKMKFLNDLYKRYQLEPENRRWNIHRPAKDYLHKVPDYDNYYSFSFIRNPFSQIKSLYTMNKADMDKRNKPYPEWEDFIFNHIEKLKVFFDQEEFISFNGEIIVNEIFPFEYYKDAVTKLSIKLGFKPDFEVKLWSTKPKYEFTPKMIEKILDLYGNSYYLWKEVKSHWEKTKKPYEGRKTSSFSYTS